MQMAAWEKPELTNVSSMPMKLPAHTGFLKNLMLLQTK